MTGTELRIYVRRLLRQNGITLQAGTEMDLALFDLATDARDTVYQELMRSSGNLCLGPVTIALEPVPGVERTWQIPAATPDPWHVLVVRTATDGHRRALRPAPQDQLDETLGEYEWVSRRQVRVGADGIAADALELRAILPPVPTTLDEQVATLGVPTFADRAVGRLTAWSWLTTDEASDGTQARIHYERELERVLDLARHFDANRGSGLREALMAGLSDRDSDTIY